MRIDPPPGEGWATRTSDRLGEPVVVEIGCGSTIGRRSEVPQLGVGLDLDLRALLQAAATVRSGWRPVCADALGLPFRSSSCDLVVVRAVLHHLVPTGEALGELARVLRPSGRARITDGVALDPGEAAELDAELQAAGLPPEPIHGFDLDELTSEVERAGLGVVDLRIGGRATFATPPFVSRTYAAERFTLIAERPAAL